MTLFSLHHPLVSIFGVLGNIISFMVMLAPIPTFYRIIKKKSTEDFQAVPYVIQLSSAMLWIYYAFHKNDVFLLVTINSVSCVLQTLYIAIFIVFASKQSRVLTLKLLVLNLGGFALVIVLSQMLANGSNRTRVIGWVCVGFSACVFVAPLTIIRQVIRTKSVEFMPFNLSFSLTLSAVMWFVYGALLKDIYVTLPNIWGVAFGAIQMALYFIYKNNKVIASKDNGTLPEHVGEIDTERSEVHEETTMEDDGDKIEPEERLNIDNHHAQQHQAGFNCDRINGIEAFAPTSIIPCAA